MDTKESVLLSGEMVLQPNRCIFIFLPTVFSNKRNIFRGRKKRQAVGIEERGPFFDLIGSLFQPRGVGRRIRRQSESDTGVLYTGPLFQLGNTIVTRINENGGLPFIGRCCFGV